MLLISCEEPRGINNGYEGYVFLEDPEEKDISFIPSNREIKKAEKRLVEYLNTQTIYIDVEGKKIPLQERLQYYKRRYFGRISIEGVKIIKIEFVFVRCGGNDKWKDIEFTTEQNKECWWRLQYDVEEDEIMGIVF